MLQDLHSHTYYSYCGMDSPEDVIKNAIDKGIELVGISDHYYGIVMNKPGFIYESDEAKVTMHNNALKRYFEHIKILAEKYKDYIEVWCGVEITTIDGGYTLIPDGVDVSMFDYCLIENIEKENAEDVDIFEFAKRLGCKNVGLAHIDLPGYIKSKGFNLDDFFGKMSAEKIFWELNVNYDKIHKYREHQYAKDFFGNEELINAVKENNLLLSIGFDGHDLSDYSVERVKNACNRLEEIGINMIR